MQIGKILFQSVSIPYSFEISPIRVGPSAGLPLYVAGGAENMVRGGSVWDGVTVLEDLVSGETLMDFATESGWRS